MCNTDYHILNIIPNSNLNLRSTTRCSPYQTLYQGRTTPNPRDPRRLSIYPRWSSWSRWCPTRSAWSEMGLQLRQGSVCHSSISFRYMLPLHVNKQWNHVRKGFIAFLLDDIACQQAMISCKKEVYRFLTWWHCLSTFLVDSELILHNKSASQLGMLTLKKELYRFLTWWHCLTTSNVIK